VLTLFPPSLAAGFTRKDLGDRAVTRAGANQLTACGYAAPACAAFRRPEGLAAPPIAAARPAINRPPELPQIFLRSPWVASREFTVRLTARVRNPNQSTWPTIRRTSSGPGTPAGGPGADAISNELAITDSPYTPKAGGHQEWIDGGANSIKNVLGIGCGRCARSPPFGRLSATQITPRTLTPLFPRWAWRGHIPRRCFVLKNRCSLTGRAADRRRFYSQPDFDAAIARAEACAQPSRKSLIELRNAPQRILFWRNMPSGPAVGTPFSRGPSIARRSSDVTLAWNGARLREIVRP